MDGKAPLATGEEEDDEVPDLVENFDEASNSEANRTSFKKERKETSRMLIPKKFCLGCS